MLDDLARNRFALKMTTRLIVVAICLSPTAAATAATVQLISIAPDGKQANGPSRFPVLSENGLCVAYESAASNLVAADTNGVADIFVFDRQTSVTTRESLGFGGAQGNGASHQPAVSADCRFVAFQSDASNLVPGVSGTQLYIRDRRIGMTAVASVSTSGVAAIGSAGGTKGPFISADGGVVSFVSDASNLVNGDTNGVSDVFTHNFASGVTTRDSLAPNGGQLAAGGVNSFLTANGRYVTFASAGSVYVRDRSMGTTWVALLETAPVSASPSPSVSEDGRYIVFVRYRASGSNETYFHDLLGGATTLMNYEYCCHNNHIGYATPRFASDGHLFFQRSQSSGTRGSTTSIIFYGADLSATSVRTITLQLPGNVFATEALDPPSLAGDAITYATKALLVTSDTNSDYDVYLDRVDLTGPVSPPVNLAFSLSASTLTLTWTPPARGVPTAYVIEAGSSPGATDLGNVQAGSANAYVTPIVPGGRFYVRVRATNASGTSGPSNEVVVSRAPGTPTNLSASSSGSTVALTWNAPQSGGPVNTYTVMLASDPAACFPFCSPPPPPQTLTTAGTSVTVNDMPDRTYFVTVSASNDSGSSAASNLAIASVDGQCTRPTPPSRLAVDVNGSRVTLTWTAGLAATSYLLEAGSESGRADLLSADLGSAATTFVTGGVAPGTYFVSLRSLNPCGISSPSDEVTVTVR